MEDRKARLETRVFPLNMTCEQFAAELPGLKRGQLIGASLNTDGATVIFDRHPGICRRGVFYSVPLLGGYSVSHFVRTFRHSVLVGRSNILNQPGADQLVRAFGKVLDHNLKEDIIFASIAEDHEVYFKTHDNEWFSLTERMGLDLIAYCVNHGFLAVSRDDRRHLYYASLFFDGSGDFGRAHWQRVLPAFNADIVSIPRRITHENIAAVPILLKTGWAISDLSAVSSGRQSPRNHYTSSMPLDILGESVGYGVAISIPDWRTVVVFPSMRFVQAIESSHSWLATLSTLRTKSA